MLMADDCRTSTKKKPIILFLTYDRTDGSNAF